jgi:hypothetical protein
MSTSERPADAAKSATAVQPMRQSVRALGIPPEVARAVEELSRQLGYGSRRRKKLETELLLQEHFGGRYVAYLTAPDDYIVVAAGDPDSPSFQEAVAALGPDERRRVVFYAVSRWDDDTSELLHVVCDAD